MDRAEGALLVAEKALEVARQLAQALDEFKEWLPEQARLAAAKLLEEIPPPKDGRDGLNGKDAPVIDKGEVISEVLKLIPKPTDGRDGRDGKDAPTIDRSELVAEVLKLVPVPSNGANGRDGKDADPVDHEFLVAETLKRIPVPQNGRDGKDAEPLDREAVVSEILKSIPIPKDGSNGIDGKSITLDDVRPMLEAELAKWELDFERRAQNVLQRSIDRMPRPVDGRDGVDGKDGRDGFSVEDLKFWKKEDGRTLVIRFERGEYVKEEEIRFDIPLFRGSYKAGETYQTGDCVNWGGNMWVAKQDAPGRPTDGPGWQLAVRRGADAK